MKAKTKIIAVVAFALALASCATTKKADFDSVKPSPILSLTGLTLDGENWVKTQFRYNGTKEPIANRECIIYVLQGDDVGEIRTRTDENGFVFVEGIPDGKCYILFGNGNIEDDEEKNEMEQLENPPVEHGEKQCAEITKMLEEFFPLYIAGDARWKDFVADIPAFVSTKEFLILNLEEAREEVYSLVEDFSFTVYPGTLTYYGADLYSLTLGFSCYVPKTNEHFTEDDTQDGMTVAYYQGKWWVVELPQ